MPNDRSIWTAVLAAGVAAAVAAGYWMARAASESRGGPDGGRRAETADEADPPD